MGAGMSGCRQLAANAGMITLPGMGYVRLVTFVPISLEDYLQLLDWAGREVREGKRGAIPEELAPILERLGIESGEVSETVREFPRRFPRFAGRVDQIRARAAEVGRRWLHGVRQAARVFGSASTQQA
jgi:hypothetical protein